MQELQPCTRTRRDGAPCRLAATSGFFDSCSVHLTADERAMLPHLRAAREEGYRDGYRDGRAGMPAERIDGPHDRGPWDEDEQGRQLIVVEGQRGQDLTYHWNGDTRLVVGDRVLLPENGYTPRPFWATVIATESAFAGTTRGVLRAEHNRRAVA